MTKPIDFDGYVESIKRVTSTCLVHFERNRYSVPASFANCPISLHVYPGRLVLVAEGSVIAQHARVFCRDHNAPGQTVYDWRHDLAVAQRKPGALRNGAPFNELPNRFKALQKILLRRPGGDKEMVLALVLQHDERAVEKAVSDALTVEQPAKQHVINCLYRQQDLKHPQPLDTPPTLALVREPQADTQRYDQLRGDRYAR